MVKTPTSEVRSELKIKRQRTAIAKAMEDGYTNGSPMRERLYGALLALDWVLGREDLAPSKAFHGSDPDA